MALAEVLTEIPDWTFGERIRKARRHAGLSQQEMADALGIKVQRYSNWETDANLPRDLIGTAKQIEEITGFRADWIAGLRSRCFALVPPIPGQLELDLTAARPALRLVEG